MAKRNGEYLNKRRGSSNWYLRLQYPAHAGIKSTNQSLGTTDRQHAELLAAPLILEHKQNLALLSAITKTSAKRLRRAITVEKLYPDGLFETETGEKGIAIADAVHFLGPTGQIIRSEPNTQKIIRFGLDAFQKDVQAELKRSAPPPVDPNADMIKAYFRQSKVSGDQLKLANRVFEDFREFVGKTFAKTTRADVQKLVDHYAAKGNRTSSIQRKLKFLVTTVNIAIDAELLTKNPFSKAVKVGKDVKKRASLNDADIAKIEAWLPYGSEERLLWMLLKHTGMRRGEAWQLVACTEKNLRCVEFGSKSAASARMIPLPDVICELVPVIQGPLFTRSVTIVGKSLLRMMRRAGLAREDARGREQVLHSLRHRALSRLRAEGCPEDIREAIVGHGGKRSTGDNYGDGFPMTILKPWVEKIGQKGEA